jgi:hypothetical protein
MRSSVIRIRRIVVLPEPEGPMSASFSPGITSIERPSSTLKAPKLFEIPSILMMGAGIGSWLAVRPRCGTGEIMSIAKIVS